MRISDWSSDVCSSDLKEEKGTPRKKREGKSGDARKGRPERRRCSVDFLDRGDLAAPDRPGHAAHVGDAHQRAAQVVVFRHAARAVAVVDGHAHGLPAGALHRSEEHTSELQSLMRLSYAVFCLKKKNYTYHITTTTQQIIE